MGSYLVVIGGRLISVAVSCMSGIPPPDSTSDIQFAMGDPCFVRDAYDAEKHL